MTNRRILVLIVLGLCVWGGLLAIGAYESPGYNRSLNRGLVVVACFAAFLGFWWIMVRSRARRVANRESAPPHGESTPTDAPP